jgi:hypothetical protein
VDVGEYTDSHWPGTMDDSIRAAPRGVEVPSPWVISMSGTSEKHPNAVWARISSNGGMLTLSRAGHKNGDGSKEV